MCSMVLMAPLVAASPLGHDTGQEPRYLVEGTTYQLLATPHKLSLGYRDSLDIESDSLQHWVRGGALLQQLWGGWTVMAVLDFVLFTGTVTRPCYVATRSNQ